LTIRSFMSVSAPMNLPIILPAEGLGATELPLLALTAALDDPETGLLIFDLKLRLLHATSQVPLLLGLSAETPKDSPDMLQLLSRSDLDAASISLAKSGVAEFAACAQAEPIICAAGIDPVGSA